MKKLFFIIPFLIGGCIGYRTPVLMSCEQMLKLLSDTSWLRARGLSDNDIPCLSHFTGGASLSFSGGMAVKRLSLTDEGLKKLPDLDLPFIETLRLGYNSHITDKGICYLSTMNWRQMMLKSNHGITDEGVKCLASMRSLVNLNVSGCPEVTDKSLEYLSQSSSLTTLWLGRNGRGPETDAKIEKVNQIDLSKENQITIEGLKSLLKSESLERICIISERPELVSEQGRAEILKIFKGYRIAIEKYSELWEQRSGAVRYIDN